MTERRSRSAGCQWRMSKGSRHDRAAFKIHHIQFECYTCRWSSSLISLFDWNFESRILHIAQLSWRQKKKRDESKRPKQNCFMKYEIRCFMKGSWCRLYQVIIFFCKNSFHQRRIFDKAPIIERAILIQSLFQILWYTHEKWNAKRRWHENICWWRIFAWK